MRNPAASQNNLHHTRKYASLDDFYDQFRYDPDYPDTVTVPDWRELAWYKENSETLEELVHGK